MSRSVLAVFPGAFLALAWGCQPGAETPPQVADSPTQTGNSSTWQPVLREALLATSEHALPIIQPPQHRETLDLLDGALSSGTVARLAQRSLESWSATERDARLLAVLEDPHAGLAERRHASKRMARACRPAAVPRLVLRLKYEKDLMSSLWVAQALLLHNNRSGLAALHAILADETAAAEARSMAAGILKNLPGNERRADFSEQWQHLLQLEAEWILRPHPKREVDPGLQAEVWRMLQRLASQPLRPVDDARFVLSRMACQVVVPSLLQVCADESRYVREHALQTLAWIGPPVAAWCQANDVDAMGHLRPLLKVPSLRPRVLAAMAVAGGKEAPQVALVCLKDGDYATRSAAADALLRCAPSSLFPAIAQVAQAQILAPEGAWSLHLLLQGTEYAIDPGPDPGKGERQRRQLWFDLRRQ